MSKTYPVKPPVPIGQLHQEPCRHCGGNGQEPAMPDLTCRECVGRGRRKWRIDECETCNGSGRSKKYLGLTACKACKGQGWKARDVG